MGKEPSLRGSACARHVTEWYSDRGILPLICHPERSKGSGCTIWSVIASEAPVPAILRTGTAICLFICHPECSEGSIFGFPIPQHPPQPHPNGTACVGMSPSTRHKLHPHRQAITRCARVEVSLKPEQLQVASSNALHKGAVRTSRHALRGQSATVRNPLPAQNAVKHRKLRSAPYALFHLNQKPSPPTPPSQTLKNCRF